MMRSNVEPPTQSSLEVYLNCASLVMFGVSILTLVAAYSPLQMISAQAIDAATGGTPRLFLVPLLGALLISGLQISRMWSAATSPKISEITLFAALHLAAFLCSYMAASLLHQVLQSSIAILITIGFAIVAPMVAFLRIRNEQGA